MLSNLDTEDRMRLMRFVCSFAWADLKVRRQERDLIARLVSRLALDPSEAAQVEGWLNHPPDVDDIDPFEIPDEHRRVFLDTVREVVEIDGEVTEMEADTFSLLEELLGESGA